MLYKTAWPKVKRYIKSHSGSTEQAEDIFHDIIIKLMVKVRKGDLADKLDVNGYLFVMARNLWITTVGRNAKFSVVDVMMERADSPAVDNSLELERVVNEVLDQLGDICRELLRLTYFDNVSLKVAAETMGLSSADVARTYHYRCKKKLLDHVQENELIRELLQN